jgi:hypothetical protein
MRPGVPEVFEVDVDAVVAEKEVLGVAEKEVLGVAEK